MATNEELIKVLLVEDSPSDAQLLCELLQDYPPQKFAIERAEQLEEAIRLVAETTFDVVLLDLTLPDSAGLDTCTRMRRAAPQVPIVVLTGVDDETIALEAMQQGVKDYLVKGQIIHGGTIGRTLRYAVERSRSERALRESEERYRRLFNEALTGDFLARPDGTVIECNPAFAEIYGFGDCAAATQGSLSQFNPPEWAYLRDRVKTECKVQGHQCVHRRPDGTEIHVVANLVGRFDEAGQLVEVKGYLFDDTQRQRAEEQLREAHQQLQVQAEQLRAANEELNGQAAELAAQAEELRAANEDLRALERALRESEERLKRSQEIAHLGGWELDLIHDRLTWSDEVYRIFGLQPQEFGATYEAFLARVHPEDRAAVDAAYSGSLRENRDTYEIEHRVVRPSTGEVRVVHEKCEHFRDASGRIVRSVGMVHDITERKRAVEQLRKLYRTLRALSHGSHALIHATEESAYLQEVCRIIVEDCGHAMVWIGYAEEDEARGVRPVAHSGFEDGYLETLRITWADTERGRGPTGAAIRTGQPCRATAR
jgi:PAS domain S-box-containing protein